MLIALSVRLKTNSTSTNLWAHPSEVKIVSHGKRLKTNTGRHFKASLQWYRTSVLSWTDTDFDILFIFSIRDNVLRATDQCFSSTTWLRKAVEWKVGMMNLDVFQLLPTAALPSEYLLTYAKQGTVFVSSEVRHVVNSSPAEESEQIDK